jgi:hypothetical protein
METLLGVYAHIYAFSCTHTCMHCIYGDAPFIMPQSMTDDMVCPGVCHLSLQ